MEEKNIPIIITYTNQKKEHLHTWETTLPLDSEAILEAVYATGIVEEDDENYFKIELDK